jgi:hypothetical protein
LDLKTCSIGIVVSTFLIVIAGSPPSRSSGVQIPAGEANTKEFLNTGEYLNEDAAKPLGDPLCSAAPE